MRIDGALGLFQRASPPNNNNNNKIMKISSVWGPVPGPTRRRLAAFGEQFLVQQEEV